jgi:hypothetical protein
MKIQLYIFVKFSKTEGKRKKDWVSTYGQLCVSLSTMETHPSRTSAGHGGPAASSPWTLLGVGRGSPQPIGSNERPIGDTKA